LQTPASTTTSAIKKATAKDEMCIVKADQILTIDRQLANTIGLPREATAGTAHILRKDY